MFDCFQKSLAKDFHPNEIAKSGIFNKDKMQSAASGGFADFGRKFLEALIPPAEKVGEILALQTVIFELLIDFTLYYFNNSF